MSVASTPARETLKAAVEQHAAAADALRIDRQAHGVALAGAEAADRELALVAASEREAGADLATRIRSAVSAGRKATSTVKVLDRGAGRAAAEAAAASAHEALKVLTDDLANAEREERTAKFDLDAALQAVLAETAEVIANDAEQAIQILRRARWSLAGIEASGYAAGPEGIRPLKLTPQAADVIRWRFDPGDASRPPSAGGEVAAAWQQYRERLLVDPLAPAPES